MNSWRGKHSPVPRYIPTVRRLLLLSILVAAPLAAQGSPYLPLDHPLLPLAEYLIARGDLIDPSPMIRPFRRADLIRAIDRAALDTTTAPGRLAARLRTALMDPPGTNWFRAAPAAGIDAFTRARRDLLRPAGPGGVRPYIEVALEGRFGPLVLASRPIAENRLKLDPDWPGASIQQGKRQAYRFTDAYLSAQWRHARLFFGQMDRNWGPAGALGLGLANAGYPRTDFAVDVVFDRLQINLLGTELTDMTAADGKVHHRYFMAHRLNARVTKRLDLAVWETGLLAGADRTFDPNFRNPLLLFSFPLQQGLPDNRNTIIGGDLTWRPRRSLRIEVQGMIDDRWRHKADPNGTGEIAHPGRWAATLATSGAAGRSLGWRARLALVSSLAYRTADSAESFVERGVGIGPQFPDHWLLSAGLIIPVRDRWALEPDVTLLRQGEGRLDLPFPSGAALTATPEILTGIIATTLRLGGAVTGRAGPFRLAMQGGFFHDTNAGHLAGRTRDRVDARVRLTLGLSAHGALDDR